MSIVTLTETAVSAQTLINRALRLINQLSLGESPTTNETANGLEALNALMDSWRNERLMTYAFQEESLTLASSTQSYTIGSGGTLNTNRPVSIASAHVLASNISYPCRILNEEEWGAIPFRTATGSWPDRIYYEPTMQLGTIWVYPVPNQTSTLVLVTRVPLIAFTDATTTTNLAPGWKEAIQTNLAISLAPEFGTRPGPALIKMAADAKANIKRQNARPIRAYTELQSLVGQRRSHILSDQP